MPRSEIEELQDQVQMLKGVIMELAHRDAVVVRFLKRNHPMALSELDPKELRSVDGELRWVRTFDENGDQR